MAHPIALTARISSAAEDAARSHRPSFDAFVEEHWEKAVRMAWRLTGENREVAEDVAQEAFMRAHGALGGFRSEARLSTWFYRILVRQAANHRRWRGVRRYWSAALPYSIHTPAPQALPDPPLQRSIAEAMDHLTGQQRFAFTLTYLEGLTLTEAAEAMGCATGTLKSHLHRALKTLRRELALVKESHNAP